MLCCRLSKAHGKGTLSEVLPWLCCRLSKVCRGKVVRYSLLRRRCHLSRVCSREAVSQALLWLPLARKACRQFTAARRTLVRACLNKGNSRGTSPSRAVPALLPEAPNTTVSRYSTLPAPQQEQAAWTAASGCASTRNFESINELQRALQPAHGESCCSFCGMVHELIAEIAA